MQGRGELPRLLFCRLSYPPDLFDRDAVERRKSQMPTLKETMATVTMLQKMQESLEDKYNTRRKTPRRTTATTCCCSRTQRS
jgi:hypothetical protein